MNKVLKAGDIIRVREIPLKKTDKTTVKTKIENDKDKPNSSDTAEVPKPPEKQWQFTQLPKVAGGIGFDESCQWCSQCAGRGI